MNLFMRLFVYTIIVIAVIVGLLALFLSKEPLVKLIVFRDFFDVGVPILAFGALIKYLCTEFPKAKTCKCCKCK